MSASPTVTLAREIAYDAYVAVMEKGAKPDDYLEDAYKEKGKSLERLDRNFIKEILYGALRWQSKIYWILQNTSTRKLQDLSPQVRAALVVGTYQIFYMDRVPDRAAVNESVEYIRKKSQASACPFVNGILRQIARRAAYFPKPDKVTHQAEYLSLQFAHPRWMVDRWIKHFKFDKLEEMLSANNKVPPYSIRINARKTPVEKASELQDSILKEEHTHSERRPLRSCLRTKEAPKTDGDGLFARGYFTIQDEAAQLIALLVEPKAGEVIAEACAGPGGKLSHMIELCDGKASFIAIEKNPSQMTKAKETLTRLGHLAEGESNVDWQEKDFLEWTPATPVDKVLLDAPCSGLGIIRRHPEGKWQKRGSDIVDMVALQRKLIAHAVETLKVGGELVFSVCSYEQEETLGQWRWLQDTLGDKVELVSPLTRLPDYYKRYVTRDNILLIYSGNQDEMDGFGAFIVKKKS